MKKTFVYSLDLSLASTGVCIFADDGILKKWNTIKTSKKDGTIKRLALIGNTLKKAAKEYPPLIVVIERGFCRFAASTEQLYRVHGVVNYVFERYPQIYYPYTTVKKTICGNGGMPKGDFISFVEKANPQYSFSSQDEVDAFALGLTYFEKKGQGGHAP